MVTEPTRRDKTFIKVTALVIIAVLSALFAGYFFVSGTLVSTLIALSIFWTVFSLQTFLIKDWKTALIAVALESLFFAVPLILVLHAGFSWYVLLAILALFLYLLSAEWFAVRELANALKIPFWRITKGVMMKVITGSLVFITLVFFIVGRGGEAVSLIPCIQSDITTRELIEKNIISGLKPEQVLELNARPDKEAVINLAVDEAKKRIENYVGAINIDLSLAETILTAMKDRLTELNVLGKTYLLLISVIVVWLTIRSVAYVIYIPLSFMVFLAYEMLLVANFMVLQYESKNGEVIEIK